MLSFSALTLLDGDRKAYETVTLAVPKLSSLGNLHGTNITWSAWSPDNRSLKQQLKVIVVLEVAVCSLCPRP